VRSAGPARIVEEKKTTTNWTGYVAVPEASGPGDSVTRVEFMTNADCRQFAVKLDAAAASKESVEEGMAIIEEMHLWDYRVRVLMWEMELDFVNLKPKTVEGKKTTNLAYVVRAFRKSVKKNTVGDAEEEKVSRLLTYMKERVNHNEEEEKKREEDKKAVTERIEMEFAVAGFEVGTESYFLELGTPWDVNARKLKAQGARRKGGDFPTCGICHRGVGSAGKPLSMCIAGDGPPHNNEKEEPRECFDKHNATKDCDCYFHIGCAHYLKGEDGVRKVRTFFDPEQQEGGYEGVLL
jgi:hypothetical protein